MSELLLETPSQFIKWFNDTDSDYEIKFKHGLGHIQLGFQIDAGSFRSISPPHQFENSYQSSAKLSKSTTVGEHVIQVLNELPDHRWIKVATALSEFVINSHLISPVLEDLIQELFDNLRWVFKMMMISLTLMV